MLRSIFLFNFWIVDLISVHTNTHRHWHTLIGIGLNGTIKWIFPSQFSKWKEIYSHNYLLQSGYNVIKRNAVHMCLMRYVCVCGRVPVHSCLTLIFGFIFFAFSFQIQFLFSFYWNFCVWKQKDTSFIRILSTRIDATIFHCSCWQRITYVNRLAYRCVWAFECLHGIV